MAFAQVVNSDPQGFKQRLRGQYLSNDTAQAIINLYGRRQAGGAGWMAAGLLTAVRIATASSTQATGSPYVVQDNSSNVGAIFVVTTPVLGYGLAKLLRFSNGRLERLLTAYAAGQPLPRSLRRKLKPRFFNQPIVNYKAVPVKPAN